VYQLAVPSASIFGDVENGKYPLQAYGRMLHTHKTPAEAIVTEIRLDPNSSTPKLTFKPIRPLDEDERVAVEQMRASPDTLQAITLTVSQMDKSPEPKQAEPEPQKGMFEDKPSTTRKRAPKETVVEKDDTVEEPKVAKNKAAPSGKPTNVAELVNNWDD
jgi:hypothetical protein